MNTAATMARGTSRSGGLLRSYVAEAKYELIRQLRSPSFGIPFLVFPVLLYLLFGAVLFRQAVLKEPKIANDLFVGFSVFGLIGPGMFGFGVVAAQEREQGLLKLKRALPMPAAAYLIGKLFMALVFGLLVMSTMIVGALAIGQLKLSPPQVLAVSVISVLGVLPFCAIGLFVSTLVNGRSAPAIVNFIYLPMLYVSGVFFPLPDFLARSAWVWPSYHLMQLSSMAMGIKYTGSGTIHALVLAGWTIVLMVIAVRRLSRLS